MKHRCLGCMEEFDVETKICPHCGYEVGTEAEEAIHMVPGTLFHDRYIIGKVLGFGGFGVTYLAWDGKLEQKVAIKEYLPSEFSTRVPGQTTVSVFSGDKSEQFRQGLDKFVDEAQKLAKYQNEPGIVKVFDSFEDNSTAYIVMEYLNGMTLSQYVKANGVVSPRDAVDMLMPVMQSLKVVHADGLLHRDIAPDNIFITQEGECKLIDFGASRFATTTHSRSLTVIVKPGFSPEEQYRSRGDQGPYTDVYSLAATIYSVITGKTPPDAMVRRAKYENENKDILIPPHKLCKGIPVNVEIALLNALNVRIEDRTPDIPTFVEELRANPPAKRKYGKIKKIDFYTWPMWLKVLSGSLAGLLLVFGILLATGVISFESLYTRNIVLPEGVVEVPNVEGMQHSDAIQAIEDTHLMAMAQGNVISDYIEAGMIVLQDPSGGTFLDENSFVYLTVSSGNGEVIAAVDGIATVPYLIWDTIEDATLKLDMAGLGEPNITEVYDENVAAGLVISQSIDAGAEVPEGTVLDLVVSMGPAPFELPNVVGMTEADARATLAELGLRSTVQYEVDQDGVDGQVLSQNPNANGLVIRGSTVVLRVCVTTDDNTIEVPSVEGMSQVEAVATLENAGFIVTVLENYSADVPVGGVISQSLVGGSTQASGAAITIYVSKGPRTITITFNANRGTVSETTRIVNVGSAIGNLPTPNRQNYEFVGWYTSDEGGTQVSAGTIAGSANITYYAHWADNAYIVTLDDNGGDSGVSQIFAMHGQAYGVLPTPVKDGYRFDGWFTSTTGGSQITSTTIFTGDRNQTLYAHWTRTGFVVSLDANGGSCSSSSVSVVTGQTYGSLPIATREGYEFDGWYTSVTGGTNITSGSVFPGTANQTLYAHWTRTGFVAYFDANGGSCSFSEIPVTVGQPYGSLPSATREGYTFDGWFTSATGGAGVTSGSVFSGSSDQTIYAHWTARSYTVSFDSNGGSSIPSISVTYGSPYGSLTTPSRDGYTFVGWSGPSGEVSSSTTVSTASNHTLTANWSAGSYTVSLNAGEGASITSTSMNVTYGSTYGTIPTPVREGYSFAGWSGPNGTVSSSTTVSTASNHTLTANWTPNTYTVSFDSNGGSSVSNISVTFASNYGSLPTPTRDYYRFVGWTLSGSTVNSSSTVTTSDNHTLVAQWEMNQWTDWSTSNPPANIDSEHIDSRRGEPSRYHLSFGHGYGEVNGVTGYHYFPSVHDAYAWGLSNRGGNDFWIDAWQLSSLPCCSGEMATGTYSSGGIPQIIHGTCYQSSGLWWYIIDTEYSTEYRYIPR